MLSESFERAAEGNELNTANTSEITHTEGQTNFVLQNKRTEFTHINVRLVHLASGFAQRDSRRETKSQASCELLGGEELPVVTYHPNCREFTG